MARSMSASAAATCDGLNAMVPPMRVWANGVRVPGRPSSIHLRTVPGDLPHRCANWSIVMKALPVSVFMPFVYQTAPDSYKYG